MSALTLRLPDDKHQRLRALAQSRGTTLNRLIDEMTTVMLAEFDAETRFKLRAERGAGRVWLFLQTDDFDGELAHFRAHSVRLLEEPRREAYGRVVVFLDLHGNRWDLIEPIEAGP